MSNANETALNDDRDDEVWREFETAFGTQSGEVAPPRPERASDVPLKQTPDIDGAEVIRKLEELGKEIPLLPIRSPRSNPTAGKSIAVVPPVTVKLDTDKEALCGLRFETRVLGAVRVGEKSLAMVRLAVPNLEGKCHLSVTSDLLEVPFGAVIPISRGLPFEAGPIRLVPLVAGIDQLEFELKLYDRDGVPVDCLRGKSTLKITPSVSTGVLNAGGDIIVVGQAIPRSPLDQLEDIESSEWTSIHLSHDRAFDIVKRTILPAADEDRPVIEQPSKLHGNQSGVIYSRHNGSITCFAVVAGTQASVGRGGAAGTSWWIRPTAQDNQQFSRISRKHLTVELRANHAWIVDQSANGTLLNGMPLPVETSMILGNGDKIDLAGAMSLSVRLFSDGTKVTGLQLGRHDALSGKLFLVLTLPDEACPIQTTGTKLWCAWKESGTIGLNDGSREWKNVVTGETVRITNQTDVAWHLLPGSIDQDQLFPGK